MKSDTGLRLLAAAIACALATSTYAAKFEGKMAKGIEGQEICIVNNPAVQQDFRDAYQRRIQAKGYNTRIVRQISNCPISTTYTAEYGQHWGVYLASSVLTVYRDGSPIGSIAYNVSYANPGKHGRVEDKIEKIVEKLLPKSRAVAATS